ncbi:MAG: flagellin N-terminal helical domain-containing protein [Candidatus Eiseniibacteriota bacterium]
MSLRVNHNRGALNAWRHLTNTDFMMNRTLERLSSGLRINSASDDPAGLSISEKLRSQVASLNQAVENSEQAITMINTAEAALNEIHNLLTTMRELAIHAANEGVNDATALEADQDQIRSSLDTITRIAQSTQFGTKNLLDGSTDNTASIVGASGIGLNRTDDSTLASGSHTLSVSNLTAPAGTFVDEVAASGAGVDNTVDPTPTNLSAGTHIVTIRAATAAFIQSDGLLGNDIIESGGLMTITNGATTAGISFASDTVNTAQNIADAINSQTTNFIASVELDGSLRVRTAGVGGTEAISISVDGANLTQTELGMTTLTGADGTTATIQLNSGPTQELTNTAGTVTLTDGAGGSLDVDTTATAQDQFASASLEITVSAAQFDVTLDNGTTVTMQSGVEGTVKSGFSSGGALSVVFGANVATGAATISVLDNALVFQVGANAGQSVKIGVQNMEADEIGTGIANNSSYASLDEIDVRSAQGAQDALRLIDRAIDQVSSARAELGSFQRNTLESNLANLRIAAENLASAESTFRDADLALEMAEFTKQQILTQTGIAMMAQANAVPQSVLRLIG